MRLTQDHTARLHARLNVLIDEALRRKGMSARQASIAVVGHDGLIRDLRAGRMPSFDRVVALLDYLEIQFQLGPSGMGETQTLYDPNRTVPLKPALATPEPGWVMVAEPVETLPLPKTWESDTGFYVSCPDATLGPAGARAGDFCLVQPGLTAKPGDLVWLTDVTGRSALRVLDVQTHDRVKVRGWADPHTPFTEELFLRFISELAPVTFVTETRPSAG
ncbi:MAG: hypothetical protein AAF982_00360 [Pseudomonadota bacterium]